MRNLVNPDDSFCDRLPRPQIRNDGTEFPPPDSQALANCPKFRNAQRKGAWCSLCRRRRVRNSFGRQHESCAIAGRTRRLAVRPASLVLRWKGD